MPSTTSELNWSGTVAYSAERVERPTSLEQAAEIVAHNARVHGLGTRHSFNDVADTPGVLLDLTQVPVEDAQVLAEFRRSGQEEPVAARFRESDTPGVYETTLTLPRAGDYTLLLRDQTYRREEAQAALGFPVGRTPAEPLMFVFPPTAAGAGVWTWIGFLVGLPLLAGGAVTALVLLRGGKDATRAGGATRGPQA